MFSKAASNWNTFRYRDYRILWVILMTGGVAGWLRILGFSQWLLDETGSPFLVGLIGLFFLITGGEENLIFGIFLINTWYLLDCSDGHLARFYKIESKLGKFLDEIFGEIIMIFL